MSQAKESFGPPAQGGREGREKRRRRPREKARGVEEARRIALFYAESEVRYNATKVQVK